MSVDERDLRHVAALARLELRPERVPALLQEMNRIIGYVDVLQRVELRAAREEAQAEAPDSEGAPLREDAPGAVPLARPIAEFAPAERDGFFLVPRLATHE